MICDCCGKEVANEAKFCKACGNRLNSQNESGQSKNFSTQTTEIPNPALNSFSAGSVAAKPKKSKALLIVTILVSAFAVILLLLNIIQLVLNMDNRETISYWESQYESQAQEISFLKSQAEQYSITITEQENTISEYESKQYKLDFYEKHVVIVSNDGTKLYHKFGCSKLDTSSFWAYNTEAAAGKNYYPCSSCCN